MRYQDNVDQAEVASPNAQSQGGNGGDIHRARRLFQQAKTMSNDLLSIDEAKAQLILEYARDAIDLYGKSHQKEKVELRRVIEQVERALPPDSMDTLRKRAEKLFLRLVYPRNARLRNTVLFIIGLATVVSLAAPLATKLWGTNNRAGSSGKSRVTDATLRSPAAATTNSITFRDYYETYLKLGDRFLEKEEFSKGLIGAQVTWVGYVESVSANADDKLVLMIRTSEKISFPGEEFWEAAVQFGGEWRPKLYSLRKLDRVEVIGIVEQAGASPWLHGVSVSLVHDEAK
jgi:hypothetical protein